jgi:predicted unusual protein kinase regulating ubiquinone biosynthesis (AarF/ABC1/UbiB family)
LIRLLRRTARLWQVVAVISQAFILPVLFARRRGQAAGAVRMRLAFEKLGGAWIKLGQMLAMRFDLLPPEYCDELFKLFNAVAPFAYSDVAAIVTQELGASPDLVFTSFEKQPFASASIGQVHRATLPTGERVAVKVQRPGIRETMRTDVDLMYAVTGLLDWTRLFGATRSREVIDEFARWTADELDYLVEARQSVLLYEHARDEPFERVARVYRGYTTTRVLTSELLVGVPLIDIVTAVRARDADYLNKLEAAGYNLQSIVRNIDWNMLNQVYVFGYFHADLHPANLYVLPGNAIGYVDFGMVGELPDNVRESLTRYSWLLFQWDVESAVRELMRWLAPTYETDTTVARRQLARVHEAFLFDISDVNRRADSVAPGRNDDADNPYSTLAIEILQTVRRNHLVLSASLVAYLKMLTTLGTLRHQLVSTDYDLPSVARRFFSRLIQQKGQDFLDPRTAMGRVYGASYRFKRALEFVEFLEEQQPLLSTLTGFAQGVPSSLRALKRRAIALGVAVLVVGAGLYMVLADPTDVRRVMPPQIDFDLLHPILLGLLILLIIMLWDQVRRLSRA